MWGAKNLLGCGVALISIIRTPETSSLSCNTFLQEKNSMNKRIMIKATVLKGRLDYGVKTMNVPTV
jgi:hypothetical protein